MRALLRRMRGRRADDRGSMAVEVVLLAPIFVLFTLLVVAGGRYVTVRGDIEASARDAARAASFMRDLDSARSAALVTAAASTDSTCGPADFDGSRFDSGGLVRVTLVCSVSYDNLGLIGLPGSITVRASSTAPVDLYRRTG